MKAASFSKVNNAMNVQSPEFVPDSSFSSSNTGSFLDNTFNSELLADSETSSNLGTSRNRLNKK